MARAHKSKVMVIGSGLGGLSAAISLATEGYSVEVYEKNDRVGGKLNFLKTDGFHFDLGPSILTLPQILEKLFLRCGKKMADFLDIQPVIPHWRNFFEDGTVFDLNPDLEAQEKELAKLGPGAGEGFFNFLEYSRRLTKVTEQGYFDKGLDGFSELIRHYGLYQSFLAFDVTRTLDQGVRRFIWDEKLVDVLNYFIKYVGSSPYDAPALMNLLPYVQFGYGLWNVQGGLYEIARALVRLAEEQGVRFHFGKEAVSATRNGGRLSAIQFSDGTEATADWVVSNMEVIPFYQRVSQEPTDFLKRYERKFTPSCSGFVLHLGVKKNYPQLAHHNIFYSRDAKKHFRSVFHDGVLSEDPTIYLVAPVKSDPSLAPPGCEIIKILPHIPHIREDKPLTAEDYAAFKTRVLDKLERMGLKGLRENVLVEDQWTPADIEKRYFSNKGSIYGVVCDRWKNFGFKAPKTSEKYDNLYFVGGSVNPGAGMPMVLLSGQLVADYIAGRERGD